MSVMEVVSDALQDLGYSTEVRGIFIHLSRVIFREDFALLSPGVHLTAKGYLRYEGRDFSLHGLDVLDRDDIRRSPVGLFLVPRLSLRVLTKEEKARYKEYDYVAFEPFGPESAPVLGSFLTREVYETLCRRGSVREDESVRGVKT